MLHPDEVVLWEGQPEAGPLLDRGLLRSSAILLAVHLGMVALVYSGGNMTWRLALGILACYILLDGMVILMSMLDRRSHLRGDHYRVTNQRVLLLSAEGNEVRLLEEAAISRLRDVALEDGSDGLQTIRLTLPDRRGSLCLLNLPDARFVVSLICSQPGFHGDPP